jgi:hypothetical protein
MNLIHGLRHSKGSQADTFSHPPKFKNINWGKEEIYKILMPRIRVLKYLYILNTLH